MVLVIIKMDYYVASASILAILVQVKQLVKIALKVEEVHTIIKGIA